MHELSLFAFVNGVRRETRKSALVRNVLAFLQHGERAKVNSRLENRHAASVAEYLNSATVTVCVPASLIFAT